VPLQTSRTAEPPTYAQATGASVYYRRALTTQRSAIHLWSE